MTATTTPQLVSTSDDATFGQRLILRNLDATATVLVGDVADTATSSWMPVMAGEVWDFEVAGDQVYVATASGTVAVAVQVIGAR